MQLTDIEALYMQRQSCREFSGKAVERELLQEVCRIALLAPSACNAQPWQLVVAAGEKKQEVAACLQGMGMNKFASDAGALIAVVSGESTLTAKAGERFAKNEFTANDLGILTAHLILAAESAGLKTCILGWRNEEKLRAVLGLAKDARIPEVVAVGYPKEGYHVREKKRKPTEKTLRFID